MVKGALVIVENAELAMPHEEPSVCFAFDAFETTCQSHGAKM